MRKACRAIKGASIEAPVTPPYTDGKNPPFSVSLFMGLFVALCFFLVVLLDISIKEKYFGWGRLPLNTEFKNSPLGVPSIWILNGNGFANKIFNLRTP
jgi:hypothetical protein